MNNSYEIHTLYLMFKKLKEYIKYVKGNYKSMSDAEALMNYSNAL